MVTIATITHKNQLTIPREFLKDSDLEGVRKVVLEKTNGQVLIRPIRSKVDELAGSLSHLVKLEHKGLSWKQIREKTQELAAKEIASEGLPKKHKPNKK